MYAFTRQGAGSVLAPSPFGNDPFPKASLFEAAVLPVVSLRKARGTMGSLFFFAAQGATDFPIGGCFLPDIVVVFAASSRGPFMAQGATPVIPNGGLLLVPLGPFIAQEELSAGGPGSGRFCSRCSSFLAKKRFPMLTNSSGSSSWRVVRTVYVIFRTVGFHDGSFRNRKGKRISSVNFMFFSIKRTKVLFLTKGKARCANREFSDAIEEPRVRNSAGRLSPSSDPVTPS
ncbi:unnamed protein product [Pseudo-nitzschia multistriata]|uniref:Uncharacterized protein n=1 Tax=Pseudo-nitzschia multistriata TaxID=183589 RepID=A0A448ZBL7_9STRA|nr:unnamed protein product [Pseudo-nitzschia multistriata]